MTRRLPAAVLATILLVAVVGCNGIHEDFVRQADDQAAKIYPVYEKYLAADDSLVPLLKKAEKMHIDSFLRVLEKSMARFDPPEVPTAIKAVNDGRAERGEELYEPEG